MTIFGGTTTKGIWHMLLSLPRRRGMGSYTVSNKHLWFGTHRMEKSFSMLPSANTIRFPPLQSFPQGRLAKGPTRYLASPQPILACWENQPWWTLVHHNATQDDLCMHEGEPSTQLQDISQLVNRLWPGSRQTVAVLRKLMFLYQPFCNPLRVASASHW